MRLTLLQTVCGKSDNNIDNNTNKQAKRTLHDCMTIIVELWFCFNEVNTTMGLCLALSVYSINSNFSNFGNSLNFEQQTSIFGKTKKQSTILRKTKMPLKSFHSFCRFLNCHHKWQSFENDDKMKQNFGKKDTPAPAPRFGYYPITPFSSFLCFFQWKVEF